MEQALIEEIKQHKIKIYDILIQLINTNNVDEEIILNNEIKNETNFIFSLLNIKKNLTNNIPSNNNPFKPFLQKQIINIPSQRYVGLNNLEKQGKLKEPILPKRIDVFFTVKELNEQEQEKSGMFLQCFPDDKVSDIIQKYREITNNYSPDIQFFFNDLKLNEINSTVNELGLYHNSKIIVTTSKNEEKEYKEEEKEESEEENKSKEQESEEKEEEEKEEEKEEEEEKEKEERKESN